MGQRVIPEVDSASFAHIELHVRDDVIGRTPPLSEDFRIRPSLIDCLTAGADDTRLFDESDGRTKRLWLGKSVRHYGSFSGATCSRVAWRRSRPSLQNWL